MKNQPSFSRENRNVEFIGFTPDDSLRQFIACRVEDLLERVPLGSKCKLIIQQEKEKLDLQMNILLDTLWGPVAHKVVNLPRTHLRDAFEQVKEKIGRSRYLLPDL